MRQIKAFSILLVLPIFLYGCYSFNTTQILNEPAVTTKSSVLVEASSAKENTYTNDVLCPMFIPTPTSTPPELPIKKLESISRNNVRAIDELEQEHIADLRKYINETRQSIRNEYAQYLTKCYEFAIRNNSKN